jgi:hypothetical protein
MFRPNGPLSGLQERKNKCTVHFGNTDLISLQWYILHAREQSSVILFHGVEDQIRKILLFHTWPSILFFFYFVNKASKGETEHKIFASFHGIE